MCNTVPGAYTVYGKWWSGPSGQPSAQELRHPLHMRGWISPCRLIETEGSRTLVDLEEGESARGSERWETGKGR